jgi:hypothetical protein
MSPTVVLTLCTFVRAAFDLGLVLSGLALPFFFIGFLSN